MNKSIILIGGGVHCKAVIDILECAGEEIAGIVRGVDASSEPVLGYSVLGQDADLPELRQHFSKAIIAVGQIKSSATRRTLFQKLLALDFAMPVIISPLAYVSRHASAGNGTLVMHHALINAASHIGVNCIINTKALIEHDCFIGDHCHIAPRAVICGGVRIGNDTFIGAGTTIRQGLSIGSNCIVGMGSIILHDIPDNSAVCGKA